MCDRHQKEKIWEDNNLSEQAVANGRFAAGYDREDCQFRHTRQYEQTIQRLTTKPAAPPVATQQARTQPAAKKPKRAAIVEDSSEEESASGALGPTTPCSHHHPHPTLGSCMCR